tara:strand:- start:165 stop:431 length:267 start_codon:yes stop_codon:yes gene_type:complete
MALLPPIHTPLNQHSLTALESWLQDIGAEKNSQDPCLWDWEMPKWKAAIKMDKDTLNVTWEKDGEHSNCSFPYGLSRNDVQSAIFQGP